MLMSDAEGRKKESKQGITNNTCSPMEYCVCDLDVVFLSFLRHPEPFSCPIMDWVPADLQ